MNWLYTLIFSGLLISPEVPNIDVANLVTDSGHSAVYEIGGETERFEQTYPFSANGRVAVSNVNGSIVVEAWDRNEIKLEYVKTAETKEELSEVNVIIDAQSNSFSVEAKGDDWRTRNERARGQKWSRVVVEFKLMVPRGAALDEIETVNGSVAVSNFANRARISSVNGGVTATNLHGSAEMSTVNGTVTADFNTVAPSGKIALSTVNGAVKLVLPSDVNATVRADSLNGNITNDFGLLVRKGKYVGNDLYGRIGDGAVSIKLNSINGPLTIVRRSDGKNLSPSTNLLTTKPGEHEQGMFPAAKIDREANKAIRESMKVARAEMRAIQPELVRVAAASAVQAAAVVDMKEMKDRVNKAVAAQNASLAVLADGFGFSGVPQIKKKTNAFPVKGIPLVEVDSRGCSVVVRGWDKSEVAYSVTQFSDPRNTEEISMNENVSDKGIALKVVNHAYEARRGNFFEKARRMRIEVSVPRKANLKIVSNGEIRIEGVTGEVNLQGEDEAINVRESDGKLIISNTGGIVRVVGFRGDLTAKTSDGEFFMDGDFTNISATGSDSIFVLTLPDDIDADVSMAGGEVNFTIEDLANGREVSKNNWRFGKGGRKYQFRANDGSLLVKNRDLIDSN